MAYDSQCATATTAAAATTLTLAVLLVLSPQATVPLESLSQRQTKLTYIEVSGGDLLQLGTLGVQSWVDGRVGALTVQGDTIILLQNHLHTSSNDIHSFHTTRNVNKFIH